MTLTSWAAQVVRFADDFDLMGGTITNSKTSPTDSKNNSSIPNGGQYGEIEDRGEQHEQHNKKPSETGDAPQRFFCHNIALYIQIKGNVLRAQ
ncbi:hypothetical protein DPMN_175767 [Dreissena polymorpha]|uniref:Uncharacterized protein n=1 Tax=Dreissena polymorpha TaxID=45954 RepID=A0A9D4E8F8_DREPO|nr:hypothetical protein DPMN_175767 [Dreissena polymorpha]